MAGMMRRSGEVLKADDDTLVVRFERVAACGSCRAAKVCGTARTTELVLARTPGHKPGELVEVEIDGASALWAVLVTHLVPLLGLLAGMGGASLIDLTDAGIAGLSFAGLGLGFIASRRLAPHPALQPVPRIISDPPCTSATDHQEHHR